MDPNSVTAQLDVELREFLANLGQAGDAEVLAFQKVVSGPPDDFTNRIQSQPDHCLTSSDAESQIGDRTFQQGLFVG